MTEITMSARDARRQFGKVLESVGQRGEEVVVERRGKPVAVFVSISTYRQMLDDLAEEQPPVNVDVE